MAGLNLSSPVMKSHVLLRSQYHNSGFTPIKVTFPRKPVNNLSLRCTSVPPLQATSPYSPKNGCQSIIKWRNIVEHFPIDTREDGATTREDDAPKLPNSKQEKEEEPFRLYKWPMWLIGPSVLLMTAMAPTLWLPLPSVFVVVDTAGFLALVGLDCIFNKSATLFFVVADTYGRPKRSSNAIESQIPLSNKLWNTIANAAGFAFPLIMLMASSRRILRPPLPFISFAVMLGPYLLMLAVQIVVEALTWKWKSPTWLVVPVVYEVYRLFQLRRAIRLAVLVGAPAWSVEGLIVLISGWLLIFVVQLMRVAWFSGYAAKSQQRRPV